MDQTPRTPAPPGGWPTYLVEVDGFIFHFADLDEIDAIVDVFERRILPQTRARRSDFPRAAQNGPPLWRNRHWLSRLPARVKPFKYRLKAAAYLRRAKALFTEPT